MILKTSDADKMVTDQDFSSFSAHNISTLARIRDEVELRRRLAKLNGGTQITDNEAKKYVQDAIRNAIADVADNKGITPSSVADKCRRQMELNAKEYRDLVFDHFFHGKDTLINQVCSHAKPKKDNIPCLRSVMEQIQLT